MAGLTNLTVQGSSGNIVNQSHAYYANGQLETATDSVNPGLTASYSYDYLNRLTAASTSTWGLAWTYDDFGNRLTQSATAGSPPTSSLTYDTTNYTNRIVSSGYTYDAKGNLTTQPKAAQAPVTNPGFESGSVSPWTVLGGATATVESGVVHSRTYSLSVSGPSTGAGVYQDITGLTPGQEYVASAWVQVTSGAQGLLYLDDTTGNPLGSSLTTGVWQYLSLAYTVDSTGAIRIHLWASERS